MWQYDSPAGTAASTAQLTVAYVAPPIDRGRGSEGVREGVGEGVREGVGE